ncbi:MAG TPA: flavodoxin domain-containing protein [Nocardioidaceae bacterium]|nr:flavodoxin domain-containing protein [Nocardioidaceae bacterium]
MRALIIYESMFGNTRDIAYAIAEGLQRYVPTDVVEVGDAPPELAEDVDLLVVGAPTHAFGMSRPRTRTDAAGRVATPVVSRGVGLREWLRKLPKSNRRRFAATFDTRAEMRVQALTGSAARGAAKRLHRRGFRLIRHPESFYVTDVNGPLAAGEIGHAEFWGRQLGFSLERTAVRRGYSTE